MGRWADFDVVTRDALRATLEELRALVGECDVVVARELTKSHEQLVRGPISTVVNDQIDERGEFTVVVDIGHSIELQAQRPRSGAELLTEFSGDTKNVVAKNGS